MGLPILMGVVARVRAGLGTIFLGTILLGTILGDGLIEIEMSHEIANLRAGEKTRIQSVKEKPELRGLFQFFRSVDRRFQVLGRDHRPVIGEKYRRVFSG